MRIAAISLLILATFTGCLSLHAQVPEDVVRQHAAQEEGLEFAAICSHEDRRFSEGASVCMTERRMVCDPSGRWMREGDC
ncbi:MAG: hypothetical protein AAF430_05330 [Myxococcota bacterium]